MDICYRYLGPILPELYCNNCSNILNLIDFDQELINAALGILLDDTDGMEEDYE